MKFDSKIILGVAAMAFIVTLSNILVTMPFDFEIHVGGTSLVVKDILTWGAFSYPFAFLITDLVNRRFGPKQARKVAYIGFLLAVILSIFTATPRIALASGTAFLCAQMLDVSIFNRLRQLTWWKAPLASSTLASVLDTALFFSIAFAGTGVPWTTLAIGDLGVKLLMAGFMLIPFHLAVAYFMPAKKQTA